jgi:hypothetical protein
VNACSFVSRGFKLTPPPGTVLFMRPAPDRAVRFNSVGRCLFAVPCEIHNKGQVLVPEPAGQHVGDKDDDRQTRRDEPSVLRLRGSTRQSQLLIRPGGCFGTHDNNASWRLRNARPLGLDQNRQSPVLCRLISRAISCFIIAQVSSTHRSKRPSYSGQYAE